MAIGVRHLSNADEIEGSMNAAVSVHLHWLSSFYCCPSGFKELRPARKISSVDNKLTAITELNTL